MPCTGQTPNTGVLRRAFPDSISPDSGRILVQPTLQIASDQNVSGTRFALGDVADTVGPKMGRAAMLQAEIVAGNIVGMIKRQKASRIYKPWMSIEGLMHVTVGMVSYPFRLLPSLVPGLV